MPRRRIWACRSVVSRHDCRAAFAGNELYLKGLYLGYDVDPSGLLEIGDRAEEADDARQPRKWRDADHRRDQGEARRWHWLAALDFFQRVLQHERTAVRIADQHQRLAWTDPFPHVADAETDRGEPVLPDSGGERGRHGAVPGHPQRQTVVTARPQCFSDRAHAVRRVGETVNQEGPASNLAGRHNLVRAVVIRTHPRGVRSAAAVVAVGRRRYRSGGRALDPIVHVPEDGLFTPQIIREGCRLEIRRGRVGRRVAVPWFEIRQAPPRVNGAADDHGREYQHRGPEGPDEPAFHR